MNSRANKQIQLDDFLKNRILCNLKSDDSDSFALFTEYSLDRTANKYIRHIMYLDMHDRSVTELDLPDEVDDYFLRKGDIILKSVKNNETVLYSYNHVGNLCSPLFTLPARVDRFCIGRSHLFYTAEAGGLPRDAEVLCSSRGPFFNENRGVQGEGITGLFRADHGGRNISMMTSPEMNLDKVDFDEENNTIIFTAFRAEGLKPVDSAIYLYDMEREEIKLLSNRFFRIDNVISMNKTSVLFTGVNLNRNSRNDNQQIYEINPETLAVRQFGRELHRSNENFCIATDSVFGQSRSLQKNRGYLYFKQVEHDREILCRISPEGEKEIVTDQMKCIVSYTVTEKGVLLTGLNNLQLSELYLSENGNLSQLTCKNKWLDKVSLSVPERLTVSVEGVDIDGFVYPPAEVEKDTKYPAILMIHGGPKMLFSDVYAHDIQMLCANGYYVFNANPMGSDGKGDTFSNIRGKYGSLPFKQLMAFTDRVLETHPQINIEALGVTGGSYGGYMTNYIITRTTRFKAAVSERGISSLTTSFTSSAIGCKYVTEYMNNETPWSAPEAYKEASPLCRADKVITPTLFIHGRQDYTCLYAESFNMYTALLYHRTDTRLCLFEGEGHGLVVRGKPLNKLRRYREMLTWFDNYLKKEIRK